MAAKLLFVSLVFIILALAGGELAKHNGDVGLVNETLERRFHLEPETIEEDEDENEEGMPRRSLYWRAPAPRRYYISYGALLANRIPCPARSGRSYYTHNCFGASGRANPYTRSCTAVTRCRR